jgi:phage major head subunit gpT-like protein
MSGFLNNPSTLTPFVRGTLIKALNAEPRDDLGLFCRMQASTQRYEDFAVVGAAPMLREVVGDIQTEGMADATQRIEPAVFSTKIIVKKEDLEDDQIGALEQRVRDVAQGAWRQRRAEVLRAITANPTWVDGTAYFADSRPARGRGAAYDNNLAGAGTTTANVITDLIAGTTALRTFQDESGQPFNEDMSTIGIIAPPGLEQPINQALMVGQVGGTNNVFTQLRKWVVVTDARIADANDWYMFVLSGSQKPVVFVDRVSLEMSDHYEDFKWSFSFRARNRAQLVHPPLGVRIVNT